MGIFFILLFSSAYSFATIKTSAPFNEVTWKMYKTDSCIDETLIETGLRRCKDNSISYIQPESRGSSGWEGRCGHTFAANSLMSICSINKNVEKFFAPYFRDFTPGVRPKTLTKGLINAYQLFKKDCVVNKKPWSLVYEKDAAKYITFIKKSLRVKINNQFRNPIYRDSKVYFTNPIAAFIQNPNSLELHWIAIIDSIKKNNECHFVINHWDNQYEVPCKLIAKWSKKVGQTYPIVLKPYTLVVYND